MMEDYLQLREKFNASQQNDLVCPQKSIAMSCIHHSGTHKGIFHDASVIQQEACFVLIFVPGTRHSQLDRQRLA